MELYLSHPIPLVTDTWLNGYQIGGNTTVALEIPGYTFELFGVSGNTVYVSANGVSHLPSLMKVSRFYVSLFLFMTNTNSHHSNSS